MSIGTIKCLEIGPIFLGFWSENSTCKLERTVVVLVWTPVPWGYRMVTISSETNTTDNTFLDGEMAISTAIVN